MMEVAKRLMIERLNDRGKVWTKKYAKRSCFQRPFGTKAYRFGALALTTFEP